MINFILILLVISDIFFNFNLKILENIYKILNFIYVEFYFKYFIRLEIEYPIYFFELGRVFHF